MTRRRASVWARLPRSGLQAWREIDDLGSDFMEAAEDVPRTGIASDRFLPPFLKEVVTGITALPPELIVAQINGGPQRVSATFVTTAVP